MLIFQGVRSLKPPSNHSASHPFLHSLQHSQRNAPTRCGTYWTARIGKPYGRSKGGLVGETTVVGRHPAPLEVGSFSHDLQGILHHPRWENSPDFWSISSITCQTPNFPSKAWTLQVSPRSGLPNPKPARNTLTQDYFIGKVGKSLTTLRLWKSPIGKLEKQKVFWVKKYIPLDLDLPLFRYIKF